MFDSFIAYVKNLAEKHYLIKHSTSHESFYRFDFDELAEQLRNITRFPAMVLEGSNIRYEYFNADQIFKPRDSAIIFVQKVADINNSNQVQAVFDEIEDIADDFFIRMDSDRKVKTIKAITNFDLNSVEGQRMSDNENNLLMIRYSFTLKGRMANEVITSKWTDL